MGRMWKPSVRLVVLVFLCLCFSDAFPLTVNRLNGGANVIYIDFSIPGKIVPLELVRSYNSITALNEQSGWNGAFGWGWTSPFETTLTVTPERHVILRDGTSGNTVLFKSENEDPQVKQAFFENVRIAYYERKLGRKLKPEESKQLMIPEKMLARLKTDPQFRAEIASKFDVKAPMPRGELLISSEYGYQTLQFKDNTWIRERDGVTQVFDPQGRMIRQTDKNGFYLDFKYGTQGKGQLSEISDQDRSMSLKFTWRQDKVIEVTDNRSQRARYTYDASGNLTQVIDSNNQTYFFKYENRKFAHLLSRIEYPTESASGKEKIYREIKYDDNGLAVFHHDKDGAETVYTYGKGTDAENNFWTKSVRKAKNVAEETFDEYFIKPKPDGTKYLYKQDHRENGVTSVTIFTSCCGKPLQVTKNGETVNYKYYDNGLLQERIGPREELKLEYDPRWKKVSKVTQNGVTSTYDYDGHGNLVKAFNSRSEKVALRYDHFGRILEMTDSDKRQISFRYGDNGKPVLIEEKGVGTIKIDYDGEGRIRKTATVLAAEKGRRPSEAKSQEVVRRVMKGFQHLLDIIRPAGAGLATS